MHDMPLMIQSLDVSWLGVFHLYTSRALDYLAWGLSTIGWLGACWWIFAAVLWFRGYRLLAAQIALALVVSGIGAGAIKHVIHRVRPSELMPQFLHLTSLPNLPDSGWSFPSGHMAFAAAAAFAAVFATHKRWAWWLVLGALLIGWARIYQGVHWPSDVIAGLIIGIVAAVISVVASVAFEKTPLFVHGKQMREAALQREPSSSVR